MEKLSMKWVIPDIEKAFTWTQLQGLGTNQAKRYYMYQKLLMVKNMMRFIIIFLSIMTLVVIIPLPLVGKRHPSQAVEPAFLKLSVQWPASFCNENSLRKTCTKPIPSRFTIHSLWGFDASNRPLPHCRKPSTNLDQNLLSHLEVELEQVWPSHNGPDFEFWTAQWDKHGVCLTGMTPKKYFQTSLALMRKIGSLEDHLSRRGVLPSEKTSYGSQDFPTAIDDEVGFITEIKCNEKEKGQSQINEVRFCATPGGELIDCPHDPTPPTSRHPIYEAVDCPVLVIFPPPPPPPLLTSLLSPTLLAFAFALYYYHFG